MILLIMIVETIRKHIKACGKTRYRISQDTGVDEATLCRIAAGRTCSTETADILCKYLGLELTSKKNKKKKAR